MKSVVVKQSGESIIEEVYIGNTHSPIQQAINYLKENGGGKVFIEKGIYTISTPISLDSNIEICGEGRHTVLKSNVADSGDNAVIQIIGAEGNEKENIYIHDLLIGNNENTKIGHYGIHLKYVGKHSEDKTLEKTGATIDNCKIQNNNSNGIYLYSSSNNTISNNTVQNNSAIGIYLSSSSNNNTISNNTVQNNGSGIYLGSSSNNNTISNNISQNNNSNGIYLYSSSNNTVSNNISQNNSNTGISLKDSSNNTISNNISQNNTNTGIYLSTSSNNTITGNQYQSISNSGSNNIITPNKIIS